MNERMILCLKEQAAGFQIDLTQWQSRLEALVEVLREFSLAQLQQLLVHLPDEMQRPPLDLASHLPREYVRWLALPLQRNSWIRIARWRLRSCNTYFVAALLSDLASSRITLKEAVRLASVGRISQSALRARSFDYVRHRLGDPQDHLPDQFLSLLGEMAWSDLMFRHRVASEIRAFLREEVLFAKGDDHVVIFSVKVFWLLSALSVQTSPVQTQLLRANSVAAAARRAAARLAEHGVKEACSDHWAGFWEQWLVKQMLERWPQAFARLDTNLRVSLLQLPVLEGRGRGERVASPDSHHNQLDLAVSDWQDHVPSWYQGHIRKGSRD